MRSRRLLLRVVAAAALALLAAGCGWFRPPLDEVGQTIARCPAFDAGRVEASATQDAEPLALRAAEAPSWSTHEVVPGRILVRYRAPSGADPGLRPAAAVRDAHGLRRLRGLLPDTELVAVDGDLASALERVRADPRVAYAQPDTRLRPQANEPNDPYYTLQWNLADFGLPRAWSIERGGEAVTLAIIDTGFDVEHGDLAGRFLPGWNVPGGHADVSGGEVRHGTHVAGIAAALTDNGLGVAGLAWEGVRVLPVQVIDESGSASEADLIDALTWASGGSIEGAPDNPHPAQVINVSLGGPGPLPLLEEAVERAVRRGSLVVAAAGNERAYPTFDGVLSPASAPCATAVGSVDADGKISEFSMYDANERLVDLAAPGGAGPCLAGPESGVLSTTAGGGYGCMQGTSMASPFVAAALALLRSHDPAAAPEELLARLLRGARFDASRMSPQQAGFGVACIDAALGAGTRCGD